MSEAVVVRRKADGKWLAGGTGRVPHFTDRPRALTSAGKAVMVIRCDIGEDLAGFEILSAAEYHAGKTQEK